MSDKGEVVTTMSDGATMTTTSSTADELAVVGPDGLTDAQLIKMLRAMSDKEQPLRISPEAIQDQIIARMQSASSIEEMLAEQKLTPAESVLGVTMKVFALNLNNSTKKDGLSVYAVIDAEVDGKRLAVGCGGTRVVKELLWAQHKGWLPAELRIEKSVEVTEDGYHFMKLLFGPGEPEEQF